MQQTGLNGEAVKQNNRTAILEYINRCGSVSRKDIAAALNLTAASVTQITGDFTSCGILKESGYDQCSPHVGRKKILVEIEYNYRYIFSISVEYPQTVIALCNLHGECIEKTVIHTDTQCTPESFLAHTAQLCLRMQLEHSIPSGRIAGAGVSIPGIVDRQTGTSVKAYGIWNTEVKIGPMLSQQLGVPVLVENNVTSFAIAELMYGMGRTKDNLLFVKWGPGVGSAIITDNHVYEGRQRKAAELGHFIVEKNGAECRCGRRGCLETKVSFQSVVQQLASCFSETQTPELYNLLHGDIQNLTMDNFGQSLSCTDGPVQEISSAVLDIFARTIVNSMTILAPNRVMLYGSLFHDSRLRERLTQACSLYDPNCNSRNIVYSELADREDYIGPAAVCTENFFSQF